MSELSQQPVFLKDLHQPFFLKELPSIVGDEPPIDVGHLARASRGERDLELQVLELFDRQAEMLLGCMPEVDRAGVASAAPMLAGSARAIGAWRVADAAEALAAHPAVDRAYTLWRAARSADIGVRPADPAGAISWWSPIGLIGTHG